MEIDTNEETFNFAIQGPLYNQNLEGFCRGSAFGRSELAQVWLVIWCKLSQPQLIRTLERPKLRSLASANDGRLADDVYTEDRGIAFSVDLLLSIRRMLAA